MKTLKVLLADDHDNFRRILLSFLKSQKGIEVIGVASDGLEAVEKAENLCPDLVLMDMHMPQRNSIEATKEIKSKLPNTKVVMLSMDPSEFYRKITNEFADGFIAKNSMKKALLSILSGERQDQITLAPTAALAA